MKCRGLRSGGETRRAFSSTIGSRFQGDVRGGRRGSVLAEDWVRADYKAQTPLNWKQRRGGSPEYHLGVGARGRFLGSNDRQDERQTPSPNLAETGRIDFGSSSLIEAKRWGFLS